MKYKIGYCNIYNGNVEHMDKHPELYKKCPDFKPSFGNENCKWLITHHGGWCEIKNKRLNKK